MPLIRIKSPVDPRIAPYVDLCNKRQASRRGRFIAEGELVVRRLLESRFRVESLLMAESQLGRFELPAELPAYYAPLDLIEKIAGFRFHRGILGCGIRADQGHWSTQLPARDEAGTIVVCSAIRDPENLGGVLRNCAAFGVDLVIVGEHSADPFARRVLRVSMATALKLPIFVSGQLEQDIARLHHEFGFHCAATALGPIAVPLARFTRPRRLALVLGNEFSGLDRAVQEACQSRVTIPMRLGTDSLNVAVAAGIFLYHFSQMADGSASSARDRDHASPQPDRK